jgi:signal transduction histidine kinase
MFFRSIRFKIIALYMALIIFSLLVFSAVLYLHLSRKLNRNMDDLLRLWATGVVDSIDAYWENEQREALEDGIRDERVFQKRLNINFSKIAKRWVEEKSKDPNLVNIIIQIYDSEAQLIVSTKDVSSLIIEEKEPASSTSHDGFYEKIISTDDNEPDVWYRAYILPVMEKKKTAYSVKVIRRSNDIDSTLDYLKLILFILLPVTVLTTGVISTSLVQKTLGRVDHMVGAIRQVTEKNMTLRYGMGGTRDEMKMLADSLDEMLARLADSFESRKKFMEDVTHELKTPLAILKGEIESYLKGQGSLTDADNLLNSNLEEVNRLIKTVEDLLMLARFDTHVMSLEYKTIDLSALIRELAEIITILTQQKNIAFTEKVEPGIRIEGDKQKLNRLFLNILDNAVKYTPENGAIHLDLSSDDDQVVFSVRDSGQGISPQDMEKIFHRFYRSDSAAAHPGSGLGLCIAKSIAEAHGGMLEVESTLSAGSVFTVRLPFIKGN